MGRTRWVRTSRVKRLLKVVREAEEITEDLHARRKHLIAGIAREIGSPVAGAARELDFAPLHRGHFEDLVDFGGEGCFGPAVRAHITEGSGVNPLWSHMMRVGCEPGASLALTRQALVSDAEWYRSTLVSDLMLPVHIDHFVAACFRLQGVGAFAIGMSREKRERPFNEEDEALLELYVPETQRLWTERRRLEAPDVGLAPQERRVVNLLLSTHKSRKQIADELSISVHTTNQYIKSAYRKLRVGSRAELMALALRPLGARQPFGR